ncbi:hypothetical protein SKB0092_11200 [Roseomonas mucosa]
MVAEGDALPAQPVQVRRAQEIGTEHGHEIRPPLIHHDEEDVTLRRHESIRTCSVGGLVVLHVAGVMLG